MIVKWNTLSFWRNNDNIRAGAKFDAGGGAETSFPLTVALYSYKVINNNKFTYTLALQDDEIWCRSSKIGNMRATKNGKN